MPGVIRYVFVLGTWCAPGASGSNGVRRLVIPVADSAPRLVPWEAMSRAISLGLLGLPVSLWYWRASLYAGSTASEPPLVKDTRVRSPRASPAIRAASA